jgi:GR25 family glycosyltransferase involved in LPS biosynthesis/TPR repeat protein
MYFEIMDIKSSEKNTTICLNMIVKNESSVIIDTLNNLTNYIQFDYWVISDTGSTDNTQQIISDYFLAKGIPGELVTHEWRNFGYNRTQALDAAFDKSDYLLIFDADDKIAGDFKLPFVKGGGSRSQYADRYMLKIGQGLEYVRPLLINNRKRWSFRGVLHEFLQNLEPVNQDQTLQGKYYIESGRTGNRSQNPLKYYNDAMILQAAYETELPLPDKGLSGRYAFYCGRSFKDAGEKYYDDAIKWFKKVMELQNHWAQERYYSALEIGIMYRQQNKMQEAVTYFLKTLEYDIERIEGVIMAIEYFYKAEQYILINALYHKFKNYKKQHDLGNKLFLITFMYEDRLEFFNAITAHRVNDYAEGYKCCKHILMKQTINGSGDINLIINNLFCYREMLLKDTETLPFFEALNTLLYKNNDIVHNPNAIELWNILFNQNRHKITNFNKHTAKKLKKITSEYNSNAERILITFTTCKRFDLFKETLNSILNTWTDVERINYWFCVDDNSSPEERQQMHSTYNWIEYYMKNAEEKGHRQSMNIIWNKLNTLKPDYWIHMEDDFLFYHSMNYVGAAIDALNQGEKTYNIKQIVFNRNYAETVDNYKTIGHLPSTLPNIVLHHHRPHESIMHYQNSHYWPHYSFRPAMTNVKAILKLGNYDSENQFFEKDYADKWNEANYKTAFFDRITHRHIGRLTSEIHSGTVKNAYELNQESQFFAHTKPKAKPIKLVNLERRLDRKEKMMACFKTYGLKNYEIFKAVDGAKLQPTMELKQLFNGNDFGNRRGVIGCALSHLKLWRELIADTANEYYVIFEDDAELTAGFGDRIQKLTPVFAEKELMFLGYHMFRSKRQQPHIKEMYDTLVSLETEVKVEALNKDLYIGGTFAYSVNKTGAQKLITYIESHGIKHGIDYLMKITPDLNIAELQPLLVFSDWNEAGGPQVDTDIQNNYDSLNFTEVLEEQFIFMPGLDQIGHDLCYQRGLPTTEAMVKALQDPTCVGFNTLGFFKNKIENLTSSQYFGAKDGMYIKKTAVPVQAAPEAPEAPAPQAPAAPAPTIKVKMLCNWCSSEQLCKEWANMCQREYTWKNIEMIWEETDTIKADYYVIINYPLPQDVTTYDPQRTIVFQMEPWIQDPAKNWGVKTWGEWAAPDPTKFFKVFTHKTHLNNVQWQLTYPFYTKSVDNEKQNRIASICSAKNHDEGHILRNHFIRICDVDVLDVYGKENYHNFKSYKGPVEAENKYNVYANYKYCLAIENNNEHNYATEKIWEGILCESLCFYWGCPNLEEYIDPQAFVRLPLEDPEAARNIIQQAIQEDWWLQRINAIKLMKGKILTELGFFPRLYKTIQ